MDFTFDKLSHKVQVRKFTYALFLLSMHFILLSDIQFRANWQQTSADRQPQKFSAYNDSSFLTSLAMIYTLETNYYVFLPFLPDYHSSKLCYSFWICLVVFANKRKITSWKAATEVRWSVVDLMCKIHLLLHQSCSEDLQSKSKVIRY